MTVRPWHVVTALALGAAVYAVGRREARLSEELANWKQAAQHAIEAARGYHLAIDSLRGQEMALRARFEALQRVSGNLRATADSLARIADTAQSVEPVRRALLASQASGAMCRATLLVADSGWTACAHRAGLAEARAARLDSIVRAGVKVQDCRMLGVSFMPRCPSRTTSFLLGGTVVAVAVVVLRR